MALIKLDGKIIDIKGRIGGTIFTRDSSGLHAISPPRHVRKDAPYWLQWQRKWYSSKKQAEKYDYPITWPPIDEVPPGTHVIYSLETMWGHRQPSLTAPTQEECDYTGFWMNEIQTWINNNWNPAWAAWGLTKQIMFLMMAKWYYVWVGTKGFSSAVGFAAAKINMMHWISTTAAATAVPILGAWLTLVGLGLYFKFTSWLAGQSGFITFNIGRVVIRRNHVLWFGGLIARPTKHMYDFAMCELSPFISLVHRRIPWTGVYHENYFEIAELWQTSSARWPIYYVTSWKSLVARCRGAAYLCGPGRLRLYVPEHQFSYWNVPIGYDAPYAVYCGYTGYFDDHFNYPSHPQPPL